MRILLTYLVQQMRLLVTYDLPTAKIIFLMQITALGGNHGSANDVISSKYSPNTTSTTRYLNYEPHTNEVYKDICLGSNLWRPRIMASELRVNTLKDASGNNSIAMSSFVAQGSAKVWVAILMQVEQ